MKSLASLMLLVFATLGLAIEGSAGPYKISLRTDPEIVPVGRAKIILDISDSKGQPLQGASVKVLAKMPGMTMGEREEAAAPGSHAGEYIAPAVFSMAGDYDVSITIDAATGSGQGVLQLATGQDSQSAGSGSRLIVFAVVGLALICFVLWRMKATGQNINLKSFLQPKAVVPILLIVAAIAVGMWAVQNLRRDGAMTPLEAQVMEMNTPAPEGVIPVILATAEMKEFAPTVTYSGQAVGFVEQEIVPRVGGTIVFMPVYVGDRVRRGQVLARLDTRQLDPMVSEKVARVHSANEGVDVASSEFEQAINMAEQAVAEVAMAVSEVNETKQMAQAAQSAKDAAESGVDSARAEVQAAKAGIASSEADAVYAQQELERMKALFKKSAVSKDELQQAVAEAQKAEAAVVAAKEQHTKAQAMLRAAQSEVNRAKADEAAAASRVARASASLNAKKAQANSAKTGVRAAKAKVGQSRASVDEASAGLNAATTQRGFAELRSEVDGVVTERLISPGVVVGPGQAILKVVEVSPIRLQANLPRQDLLRIRVGDKATVSDSRQATSGKEVMITSVSPTVDPRSRMGMAEALFPNLQGEFAPGQFVSMTIQVGKSQRRLVIPSSAVIDESRGVEVLSYAWVATPSNGDFTVRRQEIVVGTRSNEFSEIVSGIKPGDQVVVAPQGLTGGAKVRFANPAVPTARDTVIEIIETGYVPARITIEAGKPTTLTFVRKVAQSCATDVVFTALKISAETPFNKPVKVTIPAQASGTELTFACPMNMYTGTVVVK